MRTRSDCFRSWWNLSESVILAPLPWFATSMSWNLRAMSEI